MARKSAARKALEAEVRHAHRLAGKKVSRLTQQGINKKAVDPRRDAHSIERMSTNELKAYHRQLNAFRDRRTQYLAGVRGKPIPAERFRVLKQLETQYNARARAYEEAVGGIMVPGTGKDIAGRMADRKQAKFTPTVNRRTFQELNRQAKYITGPEAVEDFIKQMQARLSDKYFNLKMRTIRKNLDLMLGATNDLDIAAKAHRLTNNQLNILIDYTQFMDNVGGRHAFHKALNTVDENPSPSDNEGLLSAWADSRKRLDELIDWAKTLPKRGVTDRGEYGNTNVSSIPTQFNPRNPNPNAGAIPTQRGGKRNRKR